MSKELKPCPFCGWETPFLSISLYGTERHYHVECGRCTSMGGHDISKDVAIEIWNNRTITK